MPENPDDQRTQQIPVVPAAEPPQGGARGPSARVPILSAALALAVVCAVVFASLAYTASERLDRSRARLSTVRTHYAEATRALAASESRLDGTRARLLEAKRASGGERRLVAHLRACRRGVAASMQAKNRGRGVAARRHMAKARRHCARALHVAR